MTKGRKAALTLGPVLFNWPVDRWRDFYFSVADEESLDTVYVGEVVCAKRAPFFAPVMPEVIERLMRAGKEVVFSSPILISGQRESDSARSLATESGILVEANDPAMIGLLAGRPHCVGPTINVYNERALAFLAARGAVRCTLPWELSAKAIALLSRQTAIELEVPVFGRMPLAISVRCYHARAHGLTKDSCRYVCGQDRDGMAVETLDGESLLSVNGTQTLSYRYANLVGELDSLRDMGIGRYRLSPHSFDMLAIARVFRAALDATIEPDEANARLAALAPGAEFADGFFHAQAGMMAVGRPSTPPGE